MKIRFFWDYPRPWNDAEMCVLGIWTLREKGRWFQFCIALFFIELGIHIGEEL